MRSLRMDGADILLGGMHGGMVRLCSQGWLGALFWLARQEHHRPIAQTHCRFNGRLRHDMKGSFLTNTLSVEVSAARVISP